MIYTKDEMQSVEVFAEDAERSLEGMELSKGFPRYEKPARQWFNWIFNDLSLKVNDIIAAINQIRSHEFYAVGDLYITTRSHADGGEVAANLGYGQWQRYGEGRALVGITENTGAPTWTKTIGSVFGGYNHTLTNAEMPIHDHDTSIIIKDRVDNDLGGGDTTAQNGTGVTAKAGGGQSHNNVQPSIIVAVWVRTA